MGISFAQSALQALTSARGIRPVAVLAFLVAIVASACGPNHAEDIADFEAIMPVLAKHGVADFIWTDQCEFIAYDRGAFSTDLASFDCALHVESPGNRRPIDPEARQVLDEIYRASEAVGPRLHSATVVLVDGHVASGYFDFGQDAYYTFEPGFTSMEEDDFFCSTERVNADWYVYDC